MLLASALLPAYCRIKLLPTCQTWDSPLASQSNLPSSASCNSNESLHQAPRLCDRRKRQEFRCCQLCSADNLVDIVASARHLEGHGNHPLCLQCKNCLADALGQAVRPVRRDFALPSPNPGSAASEVRPVCRSPACQVNRLAVLVTACGAQRHVYHSFSTILPGTRA